LSVNDGGQSLGHLTNKHLRNPAITMPTRHNLFDQISDEIVLEIVRYLEIDDFLSFDKADIKCRSLWYLSLVSRRLRRICIKPLYETIWIKSSRRFENLLRTIIEVPSYSNLVKELSLEWPDEDKEYDDSGESDEEQGQEREGKREQKLNDKSVHTIPLEPTILVNLAICYQLPQDIIEKLSLGEVWAKALLLFHLLQGLEILYIDSEGLIDAGSTYGILLSTMIHNGQLPLNLRSITIDFCKKTSFYSEEQYRLEILLPFFIHPSVKEIRAYRTGTRGGFDLTSRHWLPKGTSISTWFVKSNVESLELYGECDHAGEIGQLLQLCRNLERFVFVNQLVFNTFNFLSEPEHFREPLQHVAGTLEVLKLKWNTLYQFGTSMSFSSFRHLKKLFIHYDLLLGPDITTAPPISTVLPRHLEVLGLYEYGQVDSMWSIEDLIPCLRRLLIDKSPSCVPHLQVISFMDAPDVLVPLVGLASECQVEIELGE
jgi:hypothetical protein